MNRRVGDTITHVRESSRVIDQAAEALSRGKSLHDRMSRKRRAKQREVQVCDLVLVKNRRSGSKFLQPFEKEPGVVSITKGTMITAHKGHEYITRNISFFNLFRQPDPEIKSADSTQKVIRVQMMKIELMTALR
ncbi:hypothetical protein NDU88_008981 [Pleurodeles waltl]|uniref:Uncharacterized protein n=1 Tax=Pleurodeles waltl TaxID=8319 RepID=A0AAV7QW61_PLEWA|nr:hypothetical protein NDU88_008981 [Pleurodeles waltl]